MTLQNHVNPKGEVCAVPQRGTMMGNRGGKFHREDKTLGKRRWASTHRICCELHYKDQHHEAMGQGYTSLFFQDEVTALSAGHRPCFYCRRAEAKAFLQNRRVNEFDRQLHRERLTNFPSPLWGGIKGGGRSERQTPILQNAGMQTPPNPHPGPPHKWEGEFPFGAMVEIDGFAYAVKGNKLLLWSFDGYQKAIPIVPDAKLLTPPSIIAILAAGYKPRWHASAQKWDET